MIIKNKVILITITKVLKQALKYKDIKQRVDRIEDLINKIEDISILEKLIEVIEDELQ